MQVEFKMRRFLILLAFVCLPAMMLAQTPFPRSSATGFITFLPSDGLAIQAGKPVTVELRFRINNGMHVNSHTPSSDWLIPTNLTLTPAEGVRLGDVYYPAGEAYSFAFDPKTKLNVYTGEFSLKAQLTAQRGSRMLHGSLRYQACDKAACYPPKTLDFSTMLTAR
jgi:DsbC/DsbD-like thiol-disulfide interchange protein